MEKEEGDGTNCKAFALQFVDGTHGPKAVGVAGGERRRAEL